MAFGSDGIGLEPRYGVIECLSFRQCRFVVPRNAKKQSRAATFDDAIAGSPCGNHGKRAVYGRMSKISQPVKTKINSIRGELYCGE
jgi:hypothetical protein